MENSALALRERVARLSALHQRDPDNVPLIGDLMETQLRVGDVQGANQFITDALGRLPHEHRLRNWAAIAALAAQDYPRAEQLAAELMTAGQDTPAIRYNRAFAVLMLGQPERAVALLSPLLQRWKECPPLPLLLARSYLVRQQFAPAIDALHTYLAERPVDPEALGILALCQFDSGDSASAAGNAQQSLARDPAQLEALITAGGLQLATQQIATARALLLPAVKHHPNSGRLWSLLAQAEFAALNFAAAETALRQAVTWMPNHVGTWHLLAWVQICTGRLPEARQSLEQAMELDRNFGETHGGLAVVAALEGRVADAEAAIRRARRLGPEGFAGPFAESLLLEQAGRSDEAHAIIEQLLQRESPLVGLPLRQLVADRVARHPQTGKPAMPSGKKKS